MKLCLPFLMVSLCLFWSCSDETGRKLPRHSGEPGEVLVVMPEKQWLGDFGDSLRIRLEKNYPQLPQGEPSFSLLHFSMGEMSNLLRQHRNILQIVIGLDAEGINKITFERDKWSNHQLVVTIRATDRANFYELLQGDFYKVTGLLNNTEIERLQLQLKEYNNGKIEEMLREKFGISLTIPQDCELAEDTTNFLWIKRERIKYLGNSAHDITQGIFIYSYPYTTDSAFNQSALMQVRDSLLREFVPGPKPKTFQTTEYRFPPTSETITVNGKYAVLTRGLWKTANYFMGGPFVQLSTTSKDDRKIMVVSGFVFAPKFDKREYVREVEAILKSLNTL